MFRRVKESITSRTNNAILASSKHKRLRRRLKRNSSQEADNSNGGRHAVSNALPTGDVDDDASVQSTITVETTRTADNENRKPLLDPNYRPPTQVFCDGSNTGNEETGEQVIPPIEVLEGAQSDITKLSIYLKEVGMNKSVANAFLALVRGDNRSWEAIAVDILRQKARWDLITLEDCQGEYFDTILHFLITLDKCAFLHLSNSYFSPQAAQSFLSLTFSKSLSKLQLDLIDLTFAVPILAKGLVYNTSLVCLIASRCGLHDDALQHLLSNLPNQLEELRIFGNKCRKKGLAALSAVLLHSQHLKILDLSYQHVTAEEELNKKNQEHSFDVSQLTKSLHHNKTLQVLDLDNTGIDDVQLSHICDALCVNLEEVMLNHNRITGVGIAQLSASFSKMKGLKKISMYSNMFDPPKVSQVVAQAPAPVEAPPTTISTTASPSEGRRGSTLDDESFIEEIIEEDETVVEEIVVDEESDDDDNSGDGDYLSDNSSTPPPSADFREPDELALDEHDGTDLLTAMVTKSSSSNGSRGMEEDEEDEEEEDSVLGIIVN